ncbi:nad dependent epimerase dehydratase family protein [Achaetomium macrosporum]|uniref:Nad dependent epimerase dehydratase family protein n=1 Tax=Achaetomium macrosporum TaxID=79813 RepID=A0AAN7C1N7_9PEZI|nr:nad dependent epimerase dehydratase family protein [Achaetomium macrosporum]
MASAIVTGATGILGREIVRRLSNNPQKWKKIHAFSRSQKEQHPTSVEHSFLDLAGSAEDMARALRGIEAEYVFFAAYLQKDSDQANWEVNGDMLQNFLSGLGQSGAVKTIKRIILVTGAKRYGVHLGQPKNPMLESDPRLVGAPWPPNFYYRQEDILQSFCAQHPHIQWVVTYPSEVIGFAKGNYMNLATALGLYAVVSKELGNKELPFPGSEAFYTGFGVFTSSRLHAEFCEWAALEPRAGNEAFNVVNGDVESWQNLWPRVAQRFGMGVKPDQFRDDAPLATSAPMAPKPPLSVVARDVGLVGVADQPSKLEARVDLVKWSQQQDVKAAWRRLSETEGLQEDAFEKATWWFLKLVLGRNFSVVQSMRKARAMGWTGYLDTWESLSEVFAELEAEKILPKTHNGQMKPYTNLLAR